MVDRLPPKSASSFSSAFQAEGDEERAVRRAAFGSGQSWPRRHEADGGQEPTVGLVPAEA